MIGHYQELVDDRIGSRVGDRCWATADPYLKEKIARSLFAHEQTLAASFFGRFFAKNLNLYMLKKDPEAWKSMQASKSAKDAPQKVDVAKTESQRTNATTANTKEPKAKKRKRELKPEDEIDKVFASTLGKKAKVSSLPQTNLSAPEKASEPQQVSSDKHKDKTRSKTGDKDLNAIFGAIRSAPKELKSGGRKK
jgi:nucleolar protein 9